MCIYVLVAGKQNKRLIPISFEGTHVLSDLQPPMKCPPPARSVISQKCQERDQAFNAGAFVEMFRFQTVDIAVGPFTSNPWIIS